MQKKTRYDIKTVFVEIKGAKPSIFSVNKWLAEVLILSGHGLIVVSQLKFGLPSSQPTDCCDI